MSENKTIKTDSYSLQEDWMNNVAPNYFNVESHNMLRVGLLGYINEVMSNVTEDSTNLNSIYYNEIIPNRAQLPETIYSNASLVNYDDFNAKASQTYITLAIKKEHLIEKSIDKVTHREFYISKNSYFTVDGKYKFMIDHPIIITLKTYYTETGKIDWVFTPRYDLTVSNTDKNDNSPYINSFINKMYDEEFLFLNIKTTQLDYVRQTIQVYSSNLIDNLVYRIKYTGQLSHFKVYYQETDNSDIVPVTTYFMDNLNPTDEYFCFYKYLNSNIYEIFFSPFSNYFRPDLGSKIIVDTYTTLGSECNFNYTGNDVTFYFEPDPDRQESYMYNYTGITSFAIVNSISSGGEDVKSMDDIKGRVVEEFSLRNSIVTESDLNTFFNRHSNNSSILFIKKRDDIIQRLFSSFILFKDSTGTVLPTNTVTTIVDQENIDLYSNSQKIYMLKAGRQFESIDDGNKYQIRDQKLTLEEIEEKEKKEGKFYLSNPFLIRYSFSPIKASYYYNSANDVYSTKYTYMNKNSFHEFAINEFKITRNSLVEDKYNIEFELSTNLDIDSIFETDEDGRQHDTNTLKLKGIFKHNNKNLGYIDFIPVGTYREKRRIKYKAVLKTTDFIDLEEMIEIESSIRTEEGGLGKIVPSLFLPYEGLSLEICCFHKTDIEQNGTQRLSSLKELEGYSLVNIYESEQDIKFFINLDSIVNSKLITTIANNGDYQFRTVSVPMIKYSYIMSNDPTTIFDSFNSYLNLIEENLYRLENNFDIDMKFFNTYGKSQWFKLSDGRDKENLSKTNINMDLRIKTSVPITTSEVTKVKNFITNYIEQVNLTSNSSIYMSNIIRALEEKFDFIIFVQFNGINDMGSQYQVIENQMPDIYNMERTVLQEYVPEFININKDTVTAARSSNGNSGFTPNINIEFI